jgi:hypothetical protein
MKLSLLTPPTESPRDVPHVPIPQGWPGEAQIAISTQGIPRQLAQAPMNPAVASAPWAALARFGATGAAVGADTLNTVLHAQMLRQEAIDLGTVEQIYANTVNEFEPEFEKHKIQSDVNTFRPGFDQMWQQASMKAMAQAPNAEVAKHLASKLRAYSISKTAEAANVDRSKLQDFMGVNFGKAMEREQRLATEAPDEATKNYHLAEIDATAQRQARAGWPTLEVIEKTRKDALEGVRIDRAYSEGYKDPLDAAKRYLEEKPPGWSTKELRNYSEYLDNRFRTLRSDLENAESRQRREVKEQQDDLAITWRQRISSNYGPDGPAQDLLMGINADARQVGEQNHKELLAMNEAYAARAKKPGKVTSDKHLVGDITTEYRLGHVSKYTDADLLHLLDADQLDEGDHRYLSGLRAQIIAQQKAEAKAEDRPGERERKAAIEDAKDTMKARLLRGNQMFGMGGAIETKNLVNDAYMEFDARLAADPTANPQDVAHQMILKRIATAESYGQALPYKTHQEIEQAYLRGALLKDEATRYHQYLTAIEKATPTKPAEVPKPPSSGIGDWFRGLFSTPESPVREPVK